ncbi:MAG: hypothetical protein J5608_03430 [Alphaproteobacteria bacterium]|nr:hypothetical protein [Alphaproteobacteria bacterium]
MPNTETVAVTIATTQTKQDTAKTSADFIRTQTVKMQNAIAEITRSNLGM